ncbi:MAG: nucleoside-triphosphatase [Methanoculleaceae archaeon]
MPRNILLTGRPGSGKTTTVLKVVDAIGGSLCCGFVTEEIRDGGRRTGFALRDLGDGRGLLAHIDRPGGPRVGRYGVAVEEFEEFLGRIGFDRPGCRLIVIDEIGKMECLSDRFVSLVRRLLDSERPVLATIARSGPGLIAEIRSRDDVEIVELTPSTRREVEQDLIARVSELVRP